MDNPRLDLIPDPVELMDRSMELRLLANPARVRVSGAHTVPEMQRQVAVPSGVTWKPESKQVSE